MKGQLLLVLAVLVLWVVIFYYTEWLIFYIVLAQCSWPQIQTNTERADKHNQEPLYAMIFADTQLLSTNASAWIDTIRTDWQMHMAFQTALTLHKPDIIFGLGDLTDEGLYLTNDQFEYYIQHFYKLFSTPQYTDMYLVAGNHDIGFHYQVTEHLNSRFAKGFKSSDVKLLTIRGINFVLINSVLFEGNQTCSFCDDAKMEIQNIARQLKCAEFGIDCTMKENKFENFSRPVLLQHYPMYRHSDIDCHEPDEAPYYRKYIETIESIDCHSKNTSKWLTNMINPRIVFSGHTHDGCTAQLSYGNGVEFTISSFNWKHKHDPSYGLIVLTPDDYAFTRCLMPTQFCALLRYTFYCICLFCILLYILCCRRKRRKFLSLYI